MNVGTAMRPKLGEVACGDNFVVCWQNGAVLVAVIDGLGHGPEAAEASRVAGEYVEGHQDAALSSLMRGLHQAMVHTRGAAVTLIRVRPDIGEMTHCAIGNVEVSGVFQEEVKPFCMPGVVGYTVRKVVERGFPIHHGDILVVYTDGVSMRVDVQRYQHLEAQALAEAVVADWGKDHDDATCVSICC